MPKPTDEQIQLAAFSAAVRNVMTVVFAEMAGGRLDRNHRKTNA